MPVSAAAEVSRRSAKTLPWTMPKRPYPGRASKASLQRAAVHQDRFELRILCPEVVEQRHTDYLVRHQSQTGQRRTGNAQKPASIHDLPFTHTIQRNRTLSRHYPLLPRPSQPKPCRTPMSHGSPTRHPTHPTHVPTHRQVPPAAATVVRPLKQDSRYILRNIPGVPLSHQLTPMCHVLRRCQCYATTDWLRPLLHARKISRSCNE